MSRCGVFWEQPCALYAQPQLESFLRLRQGGFTELQPLRAPPSSTKELPSSTSTLFIVQSKGSSQHTDILGANAWGAVSPLAAPGMHFSLCFLWVSPCAVHTHGFAPQVGASLQDVSVRRMDPDSWAKHGWKTLPCSYKCLVFFAV